MYRTNRWKRFADWFSGQRLLQDDHAKQNDQNQSETHVDRNLTVKLTAQKSKNGEIKGDMQSSLLLSKELQYGWSRAAFLPMQPS